MSYDLHQKQFTLNTVRSFITASAASIVKPLLITAPLAVATIFFVTGTHAQTNESDATTRLVPAIRAIAPIDAAHAARTGRPKMKEKEATGRAVNPTPSTTPENALISPIVVPDAARTGRPKERDKTPTNGRAANPNPANESAAMTPIPPITAPEAARTGKPKVKVKTPMDTSRTAAPETPAAPIAVTEFARTGRPKERDKEISTRMANQASTMTPIAPVSAPDAARTGRPKEKVKEATGRAANPTQTMAPEKRF